VTAGYLHAIPKDPFTHAADTWQTVQETCLPALTRRKTGISDVKSGIKPDQL